MRNVLLSVVWSLSAAAMANGALIQDEFEPTPAGLAGSDHYRAYTWGVNRSGNDAVIGPAALAIANPNNRAVELDDVLCICLVDSVSLGPKTCWDTTRAAWLADESMLPTGIVHGTGANPAVNWSCLFAPQGLSTLRSCAAGGFDSGLGPDSHFRDAGADSIIMKHALEPAPLLIGGLAVTPLLYGKRR